LRVGMGPKTNPNAENEKDPRPSAGSDIGAASSRSQVPMRRSRGIVNVRLSQAVSSS
jgi:hypothetical protein